MKKEQNILNYVKPYFSLLAIAFLATILANLCTLALPWVLQNLINNVMVLKDVKALNFIILALLGLTLIKSVFSYLQSYLLAWIGNSVVKSLRNKVFQHLQTFSLSFFERWKSGDILSRLINDVALLQNTLSTNVIFIVNDSILIIGAVFLMFYKDWKLALFTLVVSPLVAVAIGEIGKKIRLLSTAIQEKLARLVSIIEENILGVKVVKAFGQEETEIKKFTEENERNFTYLMKGAKLFALQNPLVDLIGTAGIMAVIWFGVMEVIQNKLTVGDVFAFWGYMILATTPLNRFSQVYGNFQQALGAYERVVELMEIKPDVEEYQDSIDAPPFKGSIEFCSVNFSYNGDKQILSDINLTIKQGEVIAIVGPSGAGKTTLVNLIPRFYAVKNGEIKIDDHDISHFKLVSLRKQIAVVSQDTFLFNDTVRKNISYGNSQASTKEIEDAAKAANASDFIEEFKDKYETVIGERGADLSGGQRQRIAIARAFLLNAPILILDEATSALDSEAEQLIQDALNNLMKNKTVVVIAHRLSTIKQADRIIVLENGKIVEQGKHEELMVNRGLYYRLYESQFK